LVAVLPVSALSDVPVDPNDCFVHLAGLSRRPLHLTSALVGEVPETVGSLDRRRGAA
jgi:hypothetical protein